MFSTINISKEGFIKSLVILPMMGLLFYTFSCSPDYMKQDVKPIEEVTMTQAQANQKQAALSKELESIYKKHPGSQMAIEVKKDATGKKSMHFSTANINSEKDRARINKIAEEMTSLMNLYPSTATTQNHDVDDEVFMVVEDQPKPAGGMEGVQQYLAANLIYPAEAKAAGKEGRVFVEFIVDKDGSITNVQAIKGISPDCDAEAVRVISNMPAWQPGMQKGRPVRVKMVMPIAFKMN